MNQQKMHPDFDIEVGGIYRCSSTKKTWDLDGLDPSPRGFLWATKQETMQKHRSQNGIWWKGPNIYPTDSQYTDVIWCKQPESLHFSNFPSKKWEKKHWNQAGSNTWHSYGPGNAEGPQIQRPLWCNASKYHRVFGRPNDTNYNNIQQSLRNI